MSVTVTGVLCRQLHTCHTTDTRKLRRLVSAGRSSLLPALGGVRTTATAYCVSKRAIQVVQETCDQYLVGAVCTLVTTAGLKHDKRLLNVPS